jgi:transposase
MPVGDPTACTGEVTLGTAVDAAAAADAEPGWAEASVTPGAQRVQKSRCTPYAEQIAAWVAQGLSAQRIWQDLCSGHGYTGAYESVKRYVRRIAPGTGQEPYRRLECEPGAEAQVDFGRGAWVEENGKRRRPHLFRIVLSHSRKGYSRVVWHQDSESFLRVLEDAFRTWGGVPRQVVIDNLKAGVLQPDWYDPELNPKLQDFARHYGTVVLPTRPGVPRHKGKIERGVGYVQDNALKGRRFASLEAQNLFLQSWEQTVADRRLHGTVRQQVAAMFAAEQPVLGQLPDSLFPCFQEGWRRVGIDGYVDVARGFYSAPPQLLHRQVWVRWDLRMVRLFPGPHQEVVRVHPRVGRGQRSTHPADVPARKRAACERGEHYLLDRLALVGPSVHAWGQQVLQRQGPAGIRVLAGMVHLSGRHSAARLESACHRALGLEQFRLRTVRELIDSKAEQPDLPLQQSHALSRALTDYATVIHALSAHPATDNPENQP